MELFCKDKILNISPYYLRPGYAYGGACLPKDLSALVALATEAKLNTPLLQSIHQSNDAHIIRALKLFQRYKVETKIGFLGLSFKSGTDDIRNSPTVKIIHSLIELGYNIKIFDDTVSIALSTGRNVGLLKDQLGELSKFLVKSHEEFLNFVEVIAVTKLDPSFEFLLNKLNDKQIIDLVGFKNIKITSNMYTGLAW